jgi:GT2 family glycosyltransferase
MKNLAPIVIFAFNRPKALKALIESLKQNPLYGESERFVFIDGPRNEADRKLIEEVKEIAHSVTENVMASEENKGLANSIISGVTQIVNRYGKVIVLEDDLRLMPGF